MSTDTLRDHLTQCGDSFYPGGGTAPDPVICRAETLGVIFEGLARTHQRCIAAARVVRRRADADYQLGGVLAAISARLQSAGLIAIHTRWELAASAYIEAVEVVEAVEAAKASQ